MLLLMRKRVGSVIIKIFVVLLVLGFGAWGVQDMLGYQIAGGGKDIAEVGGETLPSRALYGDVYGEINRMRRVLGNSFGIEQAQALGLIDSVMQRQIDAAAVRIGAHNLGIIISDRLVRDAIVREPMFKGLGGNFDRERFQRILQNNGITEDRYVSRLRHDLMGQQLVKALNGGVVAPARWVDKLHQFQEETRDVETVFVADSAIIDIKDPSETSLRQYYADNEKSFTAPAYRAVTFVRLEAAELAEEIDVPEGELRTAYDERLDEFTTLERRNVRQMLFTDKAKAQEAISRVNSGDDFIIVAKGLANQDKETVELGDVTREDLLPDISGAVFQLGEGAVSEPIKSSLGWHVMQVVTVTPGGIKSFSTVKDQVKEQLALQKAIDSIYDLSNRFEDELGGGASITQAAARLGLATTKIAAIDQAGNDANGVPIQNLPVGNFVATVFATNEGEDSAMVEAGEEGFYILRVDKVTSPTLRPFNLVKNDVASAWRVSKRREGAQALATVIIGTIKDGKKLSDGATDWKVEIELISGVRRSGNEGGAISDDLAEKIFKLQRGKATMGRVGNGFRVAVLKAIKPAPSGPTESKERMAAELVQSLRRDLDSQLVMALRNIVGVTINQPAVEALFGKAQTSNNQ